MTHPIRQTLSLAVSLAALACGAPAASEPTTSSRASQAGDPRTALLHADDLLASVVAASGYAAGLSAALSGRAIYLPDGPDILSGRKAIRDFLATVPAPAATLLHRVAGGASADGERGYTFGWLEEQDGAGGPTGWGKYIAAWKEDDGEWRIEAFLRMGSLRPPDPAPADSPLLAGYAGAPLGGRHPREAALQADREFSALSLSLTAVSGYGPSFIAFADPNAVVFGRRNLYFGKGWVEAIYSGTIAGEELGWGPLFGGAAESGDLAWTAGNATYRYQDATVSIVDYSKYLTVWARQPDGSWKWLLDAGNARPAPAP